MTLRSLSWYFRASPFLLTGVLGACQATPRAADTPRTSSSHSDSAPEEESPPPQIAAEIYAPPSTLQARTWRVESGLSVCAVPRSDLAQVVLHLESANFLTLEQRLFLQHWVELAVPALSSLRAKQELSLTWHLPRSQSAPLLQQLFEQLSLAPEPSLHSARARALEEFQGRQAEAARFALWLAEWQSQSARPSPQFSLTLAEARKLFQKWRSSGQVQILGPLAPQHFTATSTPLSPALPPPSSALLQAASALPIQSSHIRLDTGDWVRGVLFFAPSSEDAPVSWFHHQAARLLEGPARAAGLRLQLAASGSSILVEGPAPSVRSFLSRLPEELGERAELSEEQELSSWREFLARRWDGGQCPLSLTSDHSFAQLRAVWVSPTDPLAEAEP